MATIRKSCIILNIVLLSLTSCKQAIVSEVSDHFESDTLSNNWSSDKFIPGALSFQSKYIRSGRKAAMIVLHSGDQIDEEKGTILERAELKESRKLFSNENFNYSYSFSIFLPPDFPMVATRLVIAQWKQDCQSVDCNPDNPVIALRYALGEFFVTLQVGPNLTVLYSQKESILNQWQDFKFHIRFSRNHNGGIKAWLNGKQIVDFEGVTAYSKTFGYPIPGKFYFKIGLYRDQMLQPMIIYIDDYEKKLLSEL
jgi:hypothetical protein